MQSHAFDIELDLPLRQLTPPPDKENEFCVAEVRPPLEEYAYSLVIPRTWAYRPGTGTTDLDEGPVSLGVFSETAAMSPPVLLSVGGLRANSRVSLLEFYTAYCHIAGFSLVAVRPLELPSFTGIDGLAEQEAGDMQIRMVMFEDDGRVLVLAGMSPRALYRQKISHLSTALFSCEFSVRRGALMAVADR